VVITCTRGDLGEVSDPALLGGGSLDEPRQRELVAALHQREVVAELRQRELVAATTTLGVQRLVQLGYLDSGMAGTPENQRPGAFAGADVAEGAGRVAEVLRVERQLVLIAYD
jgi:LmbE family N-acetylglucosaminyl deacetylase